MRQFKFYHINNTPELTQRLFGNTKSDTDLTLKIRINPSTQQQSNITNQQQAAVGSINRTTNNNNNNTNSLLQQHLRTDSHNNTTLSQQQQQQQQHHHHHHHHSSLLLHHSNNDGVNHSPATTTTNPTDNNNITTTNNLHHQFLLHIQNNPTIITTTTTTTPSSISSTNIQSTSSVQQNSVQIKQDLNEITEIISDHPMSPTTCNTNIGQQSLSTRPPQRRRIRRKATSTLDDQAEHLTEMSVRGLDLFRYASINEGVYQCTECAKENVQKTFKNKYSFQRHAFLYHEGKHRKVFPCPVCGKEFSRPDKMKNHMKTTHECYVPQKEVNYNPLNYLITAAAAENIKQQIYPKLETTSSSVTSVLTTTTTTTTGSSNLSTTNNSNNNLTTINLNSNCNQITGNNNTEQIKSKLTQNIIGDIEIKNEITIENSQSPSSVSRPISPANIIIEPIVKDKSIIVVGSTSITPIKESEEVN